MMDQANLSHTTTTATATATATIPSSTTSYKRSQWRNRIVGFFLIVVIATTLILVLIFIVPGADVLPFLADTGSSSPLLKDYFLTKKDENITFISSGGRNVRSGSYDQDGKGQSPNSIQAMDMNQNTTSFLLLDSLFGDNNSKDDKEQTIQNENDEKNDDNVNVNNSNIRGTSLDEEDSSSSTHYDYLQSGDDYGNDDEDDDYYYYYTNQNNNDENEDGRFFLNNDINSPDEEETSRELRYYYGYGVRTVYYSPRQNFCLSRPCLDNLDCGGCNGGCSTGGYCLSLNTNRYYSSNRYSNHNRYYYRNRYYNRYYGNNVYYNTYYRVTARPTCNTNLNCVANLPHCIRGICQATNYGQYCVDNPGCANGVYNQCINSACTGQIIDGRYYTNTRVVNCVATEDELRIRLQGGSGRIIDICSPSTITLSNGEFVSNIQNLELNCVVAGTTAFGNNCVLEAQGRSRLLTLTGNSVIIRGMTLNGGSSSSNGGAIDLLGNGQHQILDCTFNGNRAVARGGAIHIPYSSDVILIGTTFNGNTASQCFNVYAQGTCRNS